jgi:mono/diheme cytochrome c family protein
MNSHVSAATALIVFAVAGLAAATRPQESSDAKARSAVSSQRAVLNQYCVTCHNDRANTAGLALNALDIENMSKDAAAWEKVIQRLRTRFMPPAGRPRPDEATYDALISHLEQSLDAAATAKPNPGRTDAFRRLTRTEYHNVIRDLLALDVDIASMLPPDESSQGFDNVNIGGISPALLERYLVAARRVSRLAVGGATSPRAEVVVVPPDFSQTGHVDGLPFGTRGGAVVPFNFPRDGEYEIRLRLTRDRNEGIEGLEEPDQVHELEVTLDGAPLQVFTVKPELREDDPRRVVSFQSKADNHLHFRVAVKAGPREVGAAFTKEHSAVLETARKPHQAEFNVFRHHRRQPALYSISIAGPFDQGTVDRTPSRDRIFVCRPARQSEERQCATTILSTLARRAYRRPLTAADLQSLLTSYQEVRAESGFETGIEMALRAILVNPEFLMRVEMDPEKLEQGATYRVSDLELASRLSFFLWSSIPDDQLLDLAARRELSKPAILNRQVRRMLADPRSESLALNFADQWLYVRNMAGAIRDVRLFPDFDDNLRQSMRRETGLFFDSIVKEDRSVRELLTADYTFLNERLARHYGIPHVYGSRFRRVTLDENGARRGLLGHGSILTVTAHGDRTSPVLRGKWILENILGVKAPPPPPNVPALTNNDDAGGRVLSMRERMMAHRANPTCASCHQLMDPVGLATENFDATGRWRTRDETSKAIDVSGGLPDGTTFDGMSELREALRGRSELFVYTMTEKLLTYALGRGLEYYDAPAVRKIVKNSGNDDYRFSSIITGIANSTPFLMRRSQ